MDIAHCRDNDDLFPVADSVMSEVYRSQGESFSEVYQFMCKMAHERFHYYESHSEDTALCPNSMKLESQLSGYKYSSDDTNEVDTAKRKAFNLFCRQRLLSKTTYDPKEPNLYYSYIYGCNLSYKMRPNGLSIIWQDDCGHATFFDDDTRYQEYTYQIITI